MNEKKLQRSSSQQLWAQWYGQSRHRIILSSTDTTAQCLLHSGLINEAWNIFENIPTDRKTEQITTVMVRHFSSEDGRLVGTSLS